MTDEFIPPYEEDELSKAEESGNIDFLISARDNPDVPWSDRIRASIALEKLSSGDPGEDWSPPSESIWVECLADLLKSQPGGVLGSVLDSIEHS